MPEMIILLLLATFLIGVNTDCVPVPIQHTETGEDLYRSVLKNLVDVVNEERAIVAQVQGSNCPSFENDDFFVQMIVIIVTDLEWLIRLPNASTRLTGSECVAVGTRFDFDLKLIVARASITILGPSCDQLTAGTALARYVLLKHGLTLSALLAALNSSGTSSPGSAGPWQKRIQDIGAGIANVRTIIANNDEANCVAATRLLSNALNQVFGTGGPFPFV